jgi:hypothetical protein
LQAVAFHKEPDAGCVFPPLGIVFAEIFSGKRKRIVFQDKKNIEDYGKKSCTRIEIDEDQI